MVYDMKAEVRNWHLRQPRDGRGPWRAISPDGRAVDLKVVPTWEQFEREVSVLLRWTNDDELKARALARAKENPWAYGYHVLEDETTIR